MSEWRWWNKSCTISKESKQREMSMFGGNWSDKEREHKISDIKDEKHEVGFLGCEWLKGTIWFIGVRS